MHRITQPVKLLIKKATVRKDIKAYLKRSPAFKGLHIGCQHHPKPDWLNVDILPAQKDIVYMDATKPFILQPDSFDYVYSEHMIEHINYSDGYKMLCESYKVLKINGSIRISTPDLAFLLTLNTGDNRLVKDRYIASYKKFYPGSDSSNFCKVFNVFVREWGHLFIYDEQTLSDSLSRAGFKNIRRHAVGESDIKMFHNIENHGNEIGDDFNRLESLVLEADKV